MPLCLDSPLKEFWHSLFQKRLALTQARGKRKAIGLKMLHGPSIRHPSISLSPFSLLLRRVRSPSPTGSGPQPASWSHWCRGQLGPALYSPGHYVISKASPEAPEVDPSKHCCDLQDQTVTTHQSSHLSRGLASACLQRHSRISPIFCPQHNDRPEHVVKNVHTQGAPGGLSH